MTPLVHVIYPTHFYNPIIPKVALTELDHYWFSIVYTTGYNQQVKIIHFAVGQKKDRIGTPTLSDISSVGN